MPAEKSELFTAGKIAASLNVPGAKIKDAIKALGLKPALKKGACSYYGKDAVAKIKSTLK